MNFDHDMQAAFLAAVTDEYRSEYLDWPRNPVSGQYYLFNGMFGPVDAELYHSIIRFIRPAQIIEVGAGWSSILAQRALDMNGSGLLTAIDPVMSEGVKKLNGVVTIEERAQDVDHDVYLSLEPGDILFIDSSHIGGPGSDVEFLIDEVLADLPSGVLVHVHDIYLPGSYPREFMRRGYDEQEHIAAFLNSDTDWNILFGAQWWATNHPDELSDVFPSFDGTRGAGSLWITRE
jgi:hypothetical protein